MRAGLHIILITPTFVNTLSGTTTLGPVVHNRIPVFFVSRWELPTLLDLDLDIVVFAERSHTIVHYREGKKLSLH